MTAGNDFPELEPTLFAAQLTPHRSLGRRGFLALMLFFGGVSFIAGVAFWMMGAWPVFGFFGLDVAVVYVAFRVNFRSAKASEDIRITPSELRFRRTTHRGHTVEWTFNPLWVRLEEVSDPEFGTERLTLVSRGRRVSIARFLGPEEKASFARALTVALNAARRGPVHNPLH
jgi:uncharacterized membrane protein